MNDLKTLWENNDSRKANSWMSSTRNDLLSETSEKISGILGEETHALLLSQKETFSCLYEQFLTDIIKIQDSLWFDFWDFFSPRKDTWQTTFVRITSPQTPLGKCYHSLLQNVWVGHHRTILKKRLEKEYLEDLVVTSIFQSLPVEPVLELWDKSFSESLNDISTKEKVINAKHVLLSHNVPELNADDFLTLATCMGKVEVLNIGYIGLSKLDENKLHLLFSHLQNLRHIDLSQLNLEDFRTSQIFAIFSNLTRIQSINLGFNNLSILPIPTLYIIFKNLKQVRHINLSEIGIHHLSEETLSIIFQNLPYLESIVLDGAKIEEFWKKKLIILSAALKNIKSLSLNRNNFTLMLPSEFEIFFWNLWNVQNIEMEDCRLFELAPYELSAIFKHLKGVKRIGMNGRVLRTISIDCFTSIITSLKDIKVLSLQTDFLSGFSESKLHLYFEHFFPQKMPQQGKLEACIARLSGVQSVNMNGFYYNDFSPEDIEYIFEHIKDVPRINLGNMELPNMEMETIKTIFGKFQNVRHLWLSGLSIWANDEEKIKYMFDHLKQLKTIDLRWVLIYNIPKKLLQIIISCIKNCERIDITDTPHNIWLRKEFPFLEGKLYIHKI